jgi:hypothetical protein
VAYSCGEEHVAPKQPGQTEAAVVPVNEHGELGRGGPWLPAGADDAADVEGDETYTLTLR